MPNYGPLTLWAVPLLWLVNLAWVARVTIFIRPRSSGEFAAVDVSAGIQILLVFVALVLVISSGRLFILWFRLRGTSIRILIYYYLICIVLYGLLCLNIVCIEQLNSWRCLLQQLLLYRIAATSIRQSV